MADNITTRPLAEGIIEDSVANEIIQHVPQNSNVMQLARRLPNMPSRVHSIPVLDMLPVAYFVSEYGRNPDGTPTDSTTLKKTTKVKWDRVRLYAEEIAVIVPVPQSVLDDARFPIWENVRPLVTEAIGQLFDRAVIWGENAPDQWPDSVVERAIDLQNYVIHSDSSSDHADLYDELLGDGGVISLLEQQVYMPTGYIANLGTKGKLRGLREQDAAGNHTGQSLFKPTPQESTQYALEGNPILFPTNGVILPDDEALLIAGAWNELVYSIRQDISFQVFDTGVIQNAQGEIVFNLLQQDMKALRVVMRAAWAVPNPISRIKGRDERFPFSALMQEDWVAVT